MRSAIVAFAIALTVSAALTPAVRSLALATGAVDQAGGRRVHSGRIPRLGGLAVAIAFFIPLFLLFLSDSSLGQLFFQDPKRIIGLGVGAAIILLLGAVDDVRGVRPRNKLVVQASAALVAYWAGYRIDAAALPVIGVVDFGLLSVPITIAWFIGVINALNLIDGLDGLAAGIAFFACICNIVVGSVNESPFVVLLSAALCGALLGFLVYNFNPASIFMGDSGSLFLGFTLAASSLLGSTIKSSTTVAILVPAIALGVPISDTVWAFARRFKQRRSIFDGDRGHIHHRLLDLGFSQRKAVILLYAFSIALAAAAMGIALGRNLAAGGALLAMTAMLVGVVRTAGSFNLVRTVTVRQRTRVPLVEILRVHVPTLLVDLQEDFDVADAILRLESFIGNVRLAGYQLHVPGYAEEKDSSRPPCREDEPMKRCLVYSLADLGSGATLTFWLRDSHRDAQVHVLLQLVADAVQHCLLAHARHSLPLERGETPNASGRQPAADGDAGCPTERSPSPV